MVCLRYLSELCSDLTLSLYDSNIEEMNTATVTSITTTEPFTIEDNSNANSQSQTEISHNTTIDENNTTNDDTVQKNETELRELNFSQPQPEVYDISFDNKNEDDYEKASQILRLEQAQLFPPRKCTF